MGRLSKAKIDQIVRLRKKGYLQREVAQMVGVNIKTVQAYDPIRKLSEPAAKMVGQSGESGPPLSFYTDITALANWVSILFLYVPEDRILCPHCLFPTQLKQDENKKSKQVVLRMTKDGNYRCPECGTVLASPPRLAWSLLVQEVEQQVKLNSVPPTGGETGNQDGKVSGRG